MKKVVGLLAMILLMIGCASAPIVKGPPLQSSYVYSYPFDKVWDTAIDTIVQKGFIIKTLEKESGLISTESINVANMIFSNISPFTAGFTGYNTARATTTLRIKTISNEETSVNIVAHIQYFDTINKRWQYLDSKIHRNKFQAYFLADINSKLLNNRESRGFLGFEYNLEDYVIVGLAPDFPAQKAGLQKGDRVLSVNGNRIMQKDLIYNVQLFSFKQGDTVELLIDRDGKEITFSIVAN